MMMVGRKFSATSSYRFGFNGKENDNDVKGEGAQQDYGMRVYDPRLATFLSVDLLAKSFPWYSPYHFGGGNPITNIDLDGGEPKDYRENWIYTTMRPAVGGKSEWTAFDQKSDIGWISYEAVYDNVSQMYWFVHQGNDGQHYYWKHNPGADQLIYRSGENANGVWEKFTPFSDPNPADLLRTFVFIPMVALPGAVAVGTTTVGSYVLKEIGEEMFEQITGIPVILDPADIVEQAFKRTGKTEFKESAKKQLATFFKNNLNEPSELIKKRLTSSIESFKKRVAEHKEWIKDPKKKFEDWDKFTNERKERVLHHWQEDIKRNEANQIAHEEALKSIE